MQLFGYATATLLGVLGLTAAASATLVTRFLISRERDLSQVEGLLTPSLGQALLWLAVYAAYGLCGISFATWLCLATRNVRGWGTATRRGPGWAFGSWFVPFLSWWWPKQMLDDVWRGSHPAVPAGTPIHLVPKPGVSSAWWLSWLLPGLLVNIGTVQAMLPLYKFVWEAQRNGGVAGAPAWDPVQAVDTLAIWGLWACVLWTVCALAAAFLVVQITLWQRSRLRAQP